MSDNPPMVSGENSRLVVIIHLSDEANLGVDGEVTRTVNKLLDEGYRKFRLNCEHLAVLDSAGLGDFVRGVHSGLSTRRRDQA